MMHKKPRAARLFSVCKSIAAHVDSFAIHAESGLRVVLNSKAISSALGNLCRHSAATMRNIFAFSILLLCSGNDSATDRIAIEHTLPRAEIALENNPLQENGLWIQRNRLMSLPMDGLAWRRLHDAAHQDLSQADLANQDNRHAVATMAMAFVACRTDDTALKQRAEKNYFL